MQTLLGKSESVKRIVVLHLDLICLLLQLSVYAYVWFHTYYPFLSEPTYTVEGYPLGVGLKLQYRGHLLVLIVYLILLWRTQNRLSESAGSLFFTDLCAASGQ